jgi:hypothetical protein
MDLKETSVHGVVYHWNSSHHPGIAVHANVLTGALFVSDPSCVAQISATPNENAKRL